MYKTTTIKENPMDIGKSTLSPFAKAVLALGKRHLTTPTPHDEPEHLNNNPYGEHADMLGVGGPGFAHHVTEKSYAV